MCIRDRDSEEKMSMLKHDLKNHFLMLSQLAEKYQCTEVSQYIYKLISLVENQRRIVSTGNLAIDGFLNLKLNEAIMYGADIETDLNISTNVSISSENISIILGNLLDNALRAIKGCQKNKFLTVVMRQNPGILFIEIKNSYNNQIRRVGDVFQTTKERKEGHGFGLKNVQRVVEEYHGKMEAVSYTHLNRIEALLSEQDAFQENKRYMTEEEVEQGEDLLLKNETELMEVREELKQQEARIKETKKLIEDAKETYQQI